MQILLVGLIVATISLVFDCSVNMARADEIKNVIKRIIIQEELIKEIMKVEKLDKEQAVGKVVYHILRSNYNEKEVNNVFKNGIFDENYEKVLLELQGEDIKYKKYEEEYSKIVQEINKRRDTEENSTSKGKTKRVSGKSKAKAKGKVKRIKK